MEMRSTFRPYILHNQVFKLGKALAAPRCGARNPPKANEANYLNFRFGAEFPLYVRTGKAKCRGSDRGGRASDQDGRGLPGRGRWL